MEELLRKIEGFIDEQVKKFEEHPIATSFKILVFYIMFKLVWRMVKK